MSKQVKFFLKGILWKKIVFLFQERNSSKYEWKENIIISSNVMKEIMLVLSTKLIKISNWQYFKIFISLNKQEILYFIFQSTNYSQKG